MVQLWPGIPPEVLCDMYLNSCLNEGLNLLIRHHMAKGHRIDGWIRNGCVYPYGYGFVDFVTCDINVVRLWIFDDDTAILFCRMDFGIVRSRCCWEGESKMGNVRGVMTAYKQKSHEQWKKRAETDIACVLVLADFEYRKYAFLNGAPEFVEGD